MKHLQEPLVEKPFACLFLFIIFIPKGRRGVQLKGLRERCVRVDPVVSAFSVATMSIRKTMTQCGRKETRIEKRIKTPPEEQRACGSVVVSDLLLALVFFPDLK